VSAGLLQQLVQQQGQQQQQGPTEAAALLHKQPSPRAGSRARSQQRCLQGTAGR
jgi:hypothetical protein